MLQRVDSLINTVSRDKLNRVDGGGGIMRDSGGEKRTLFQACSLVVSNYFTYLLSSTIKIFVVEDVKIFFFS